ncbi:uncharacterized protein LOC142230565 isoform X2 [Haematobia irritans]|uniref:uncharacterized protein LOC142230565 isoform X2 n=1 Tax=Haematobia irritans TaxID=7368 RepID=UPI003F507EEA
MKLKIVFLLLTIVAGVWSQGGLLGGLRDSVGSLMNNMLDIVDDVNPFELLAGDDTQLEREAVSSAVDALNRTIDHI